jgi:hypothetical protein
MHTQSLAKYYIGQEAAAAAAERKINRNQNRPPRCDTQSVHGRLVFNSQSEFNPQQGQSVPLVWLEREVEVPILGPPRQVDSATAACGKKCGKINCKKETIDFVA